MRISFNIKKRYIVLIVIGIILFALLYQWIKLDPWGHRYNKSGDVQNVVMTAMGIPNEIYSPQELTKKLAMLHLSTEEWEEEACDLIINPYNDEFNKSCHYDDKGNVTGTYNGKPCPASRMKLWECASIWTGWPSKNYRSDYAADYCGVFSSNNCIVLAVSDYILQRPDILETIIYAAEHPCGFVPSKEQYCNNRLENNKKCDDYDFIVYGKIWKNLECGNTKKPSDKVIIVFKDSRLKERFHIVTKRKE